MFRITRKTIQYNCADYDTKQTIKNNILLILQKEFLNKCYLCENDNLTDAQIDHFKPKSKYLELIYNINNLFYACSRCNRLKGVVDNIIDHTNNAHHIDWIMCNYYYLSNQIIISKNETIAADEQYVVTINNTIKLLQKIFHQKLGINKNDSQNTQIIYESNCSNLLKKIKIAVTELLNILIEYQRYISDIGGEIEQAESKQNRCIIIIKQLISQKSPFSAFKRQIIKDSKDVNINNLCQYFD